MGLTIYGSFLTQDTEKFPLSILTSVRIKKVNFRENIGTDSFVCLKEKLHMGVCRKWVHCFFFCFYFIDECFSLL